MKRLLCTLVVLGLICASPHAWASCRWFGTQLDCTLGSHQLVVGTQVAAEPRHAGALRALPLDGGDDLFDARPVISGPLRLELQDIGTDPALCWRFGDETYCH